MTYDKVRMFFFLSAFSYVNLVHRGKEWFALVSLYETILNPSNLNSGLYFSLISRAKKVQKILIKIFQLLYKKAMDLRLSPDHDKTHISGMVLQT